jgi:predicted glycosyltransferase
VGAVRSGAGPPPNGHAPRGLDVDDQAQYRVLIYSHDSFGLGHLRRCRAIAHSLAAHHKKLNVLILSGSPIVGRFSFRSRVDFVRVPGIIKRRNGEYTSLNLDFHVEQTLALRASIIEHTARVFRPDLFLVDKEPLGLLGEVRSTLALLRRQGGTRLVLGLRDIMDDPTSLAEEWRRKRAIPALERFYDQIWVYGLSQVYDPIEAYGFPAEVAAKTTFTGYLPRETNPDVALPPDVQATVQQGPFLLVTPGGGGDGAQLVDATLSAYERFNERLPWPALVVYGPFLPARDRAAFERRATRLPRVTTLEFHEHLENLIEKAAGVVCLGGYNTFCEVLSLKKRSLIVPRVTPRAEQLLRAQAATALGLAQTLDPSRLTPETLAEGMRHLPEQPPPATHRVPGLLDGLRFINQAVAKWRVEGPLRSGTRALERAGRRAHGRRAV